MPVVHSRAAGSPASTSMAQYSVGFRSACAHSRRRPVSIPRRARRRRHAASLSRAASRPRPRPLRFGAVTASDNFCRHRLRRERQKSSDRPELTWPTFSRLDGFGRNALEMTTKDVRRRRSILPVERFRHGCGERGRVKGCDDPAPCLRKHGPRRSGPGMRSLVGVSARRLRASDLQAPFWGIRTPADRTLDLRGRCRALALRLPADAAFSHETAASILGIPLPYPLEDSRELVVTVPAPRRAIRAQGVRGHSRELAPADVVTRSGIRVTRPERTWCDLGSRLTMPRLVAAGDALVHHRHPQSTIEALREAAASCAGRPGAGRIREAAGLLCDRAESPAESELRVALIQAGFPSMDINVDLRDRHGFLARPDIRFPEFRVIVEYEGDGHRTDRDQWNRDLIRTAALFDSGEHVIRIGADQLRNGAVFLAQLKSALTARGWSPA